MNLAGFEIFGALVRLQGYMEQAAVSVALTAEQDQRITETVERERARLRNFIRRRVADAADADDILQEVFYELVEAYRLMQPLEQVSAWLFRVARNRITDLFRKKKPESFASEPTAFAEDGEPFSFEDLLPSPEAGPEAIYARNILLEEFEAAVDELPADQREVFIAHEVEGRSFKELAAETGLSVNTLHLRKHYAVLRLRERLQDVYDEFAKG
jgi:RNA polymerase sigma factor (sigma-70 family)